MQSATIFFKRRFHLQHLENCVRTKSLEKERRTFWYLRRHSRTRRRSLRVLIAALNSRFALGHETSSHKRNQHNTDDLTILGINLVLARLDAFIATAVAIHREYGMNSVGEHQKLVSHGISQHYLPKAFQKIAEQVYKFV